MWQLKKLPWLIILIQKTAADWQYFSRPDLSPPRLNITVPASHQTESGYLFVCAVPGRPDEGAVGPSQPTAYILRDDGDLIFSALGYTAGPWAADFKLVMLDGKPHLHSFQGAVNQGRGRIIGSHFVLNDKYETVHTPRAASHHQAAGHEFQLTDGHYALMEVPVPLPINLEPYGGSDDQEWILTGGFQEVDIRTGSLVFEWSSLDHISPSSSTRPLTPGGSANGKSSNSAWDYFHTNSIDKDDEGNYLVSARHTSALYKINGTSGAVIWQLGGLKSDFTVPPDVEFAFQHDGRFRGRSTDGTIEQISLFDNSAHEGIDSNGQRLHSKARWIELNHTTRTAREIHTYHAPDNLLASSQGNFQFLPNGNKFANWGSAGAITEFSENGTILFHAYLDSYPNHLVQGYRGFRANWTGFSSEEPAVLALETKPGNISIWVSWNGDTGTKFWEFYLADLVTGTLVKSLGKQPRTSFETFLEVSIDFSGTGPPGYCVIAKSFNGDGIQLGKSRPVRIQNDGPYRKHLTKQGGYLESIDKPAQGAVHGQLLSGIQVTDIGVNGSLSGDLHVTGV
ncbi:hypothetical protein PEBR_39533 [Penicillium brasilianum]|uniref:Secreted protein n=1 Tax=Penicillium brasilianum TaxID=104259 RepID=A0A1S9R9T8_PENBI|nr:hypothetical protein PEBR_39533 [Penicillium brasilianum]